MLRIKKSSQITRVPEKITKRLCKRRAGEISNFDKDASKKSQTKEDGEENESTCEAAQDIVNLSS